MKETKGRDYTSGLDRRILQERRTSPAKGFLLNEGEHTIDRGLRERVRHIDGVLGGALLALPDSRRSPKVGPETAEPVKTPSTHLALMTADVAVTTTRGGREDQRVQGQEVSPSLNITMGHDISQGRNETPRPSIPSTLWNRRGHTFVADEDIPDTRGPTSERARRHGSEGWARDEGAKAGRAATIEAQAQNTLADLAGTKPLTAKPVNRDITGELPSQVSVNMRTHRAEGCPAMRRRGMVGARRDRAKETRKVARQGKTDHREREEEEENGCGHEQCGPGKTGDRKHHHTGGQSEHGEDEKKVGEREETGKHKDWGVGAKDAGGETAAAKMSIRSGS